MKCIFIYSQSLLSLNKLEEFLSQRYIPNTEQRWEKNTNYYRKLVYLSLIHRLTREIMKHPMIFKSNAFIIFACVCYKEMSN